MYIVFLFLGMEILKLNSEAILPVKSNSSAPGFDLYCSERVELLPKLPERIDINIAIKLPLNTSALIIGRSSHASGGIVCHTSCIDADYRGPIQIVLTNLSTQIKIIKPYTKVGKLIFFPEIVTVVLEVNSFD